MAFNAMVNKVAETVTEFWLNSAQRWQTAQSKGKNYKADDLAVDVVAFWSDAFNAWTSVYGFGPAPLIPTIFLTDKKNGFVGVPHGDSATLIYTVPSGTAGTCTDLANLGTAKPIPSTDVTVTVANDQVNVQLTATNAPDEGIYQGLAYLAPPATAKPCALAQIIVNVTA